MSMKQLTEIVDWRSVVEWLQKYESEYHRSSFLIGLDLAYDFDCCKVEVFLNRSNISTIFWVELQCCEFVFWGWSATGAFYSRLSPVANSVKIASRCAGLVKRPIAAGLSWMMTMNSTELFVSFCCPKLSLNEILVDSFKMSEWLVYLNAWDFVKYDSSKYPCLSVYIYIFVYIYLYMHTNMHTYVMCEYIYAESAMPVQYEISPFLYIYPEPTMHVQYEIFSKNGETPEHWRILFFSTHGLLIQHLIRFQSTTTFAHLRMERRMGLAPKRNMHNIAMQNKFVFVYCCLGMASNSAHGLNDDVFFFFSSGLSWCLMNQISPSAGLYGECHK